MKFFISSHFIYHSMRNLMLIKKALKVGSENLVERSHRLNSQTYLMAFLFLNVGLLMKQGLKVTAEVTKIREEGKKTICFLIQEKGILFQGTEIHYAS